MDWSEAWAEVKELPTRMRTIRVVGWQEAKRADPREVVASLAAGDLWILKRVFPQTAMRILREDVIEWVRSRPTSFHKMLEGSPDFHRIIDLETGTKYAFRCCKHSAYFYRWNGDPIGAYSLVTGPWRAAKRMMGLDPFSYEANTPRDGVVDRVQVVRYPPSIGFLEPHHDPHEHQRLFFSVYMSRRGVDYDGGGFYALDQKDRPVEIEDAIEVGDACIGAATIVHGVSPCDRGKKADWNATDGRWFLSLYSNASDEVPRRHTGRPARLEIPEVMP